MVRVTLLSCLLVAVFGAPNATSAQHLCWVLDRAVSMAHSAAQLGAVHEAVLKRSSSDGLRPSLHTAVEDSARMLEGLRKWVADVGGELITVFTRGRADSVALAELLDNGVQGVDAASAARLAHPDTWTSECGSDVPVKPLLLVFDKLRERLGDIDVAMAAMAPTLFSLRTELAAADGELEAFEELTEWKRPMQSTGTMEILQYLDSALWKEPVLRTKVAHELAHALRSARDGVSSEARGSGPTVQSAQAEMATLKSRRQDAQKRLGRAEEDLLHAGREYKTLAEERELLREKIKNHLNSILGQCLPASVRGSAPLSRYQRFGPSSAGGDAVRTTTEVSDLLLRSLRGTVPELTALLQAEFEPLGLSRGEMSLGRVFRKKPQWGRWWEWLPPGQRANVGRTAGFDDFEQHFKSAQRAYEKQLVGEADRLAAVHVMSTRWAEIASEWTSAGDDHPVVLGLPPATTV
mmetsp:Transcript_89647/g.204922  ORF Transcript_89647/g.204922 Transcript_89647/m.204922 type:complete len:465 (+) Transcript_89647:31-1425(+)